MINNPWLKRKIALICMMKQKVQYQLAADWMNSMKKYQSEPSSHPRHHASMTWGRKIRGITILFQIHRWIKSLAGNTPSGVEVV